MNKILFFFAALALALHSSAAGLPEKLRVLSVDLQNIPITSSAGTNSLSAELQRLLEKADPDVLCLQGATDWEGCEQICKLKPGLRVLTCSAFPSTGNASTARQVAILARGRAVLSWVEEISQDDAFAFALIQTGSRKLGVFSFQTAKTSPEENSAAAERLLAEVRKLQQFPQNRPDAFLIASSHPIKNNSLAEGAFQTVTSDAPPTLSAVRPEFWSWNAGFLSRPRLVALNGIKTPMLIGDLDAANSSPSKFAYQSTLLMAGESAASVQALLNPPAPVLAPKTNLLWPVLGSVTILFLLMLLFLGRRKPATMALVPLNAAGDVMLPNNPGPEDVKSNLISWIKTRFVQRLLSDRQQMLATEDEATRRTLVIEEKLTQLQTALQARISAYESRIDRLEHELSAATFENRDLIRSQIELLKEKVAKAKEQHSYRRN